MKAFREQEEARKKLEQELKEVIQFRVSRRAFVHVSFRFQSKEALREKTAAFGNLRRNWELVEQQYHVEMEAKDRKVKKS